MIEIISGEKGKGKTKELLGKVNASVASASGNIVYLDKSQKHMYELNNKIRLIDVSQFMIENASEFIGFVSGIISQDHDLQQMYFDSFLKISCLEGGNISETITKLEKVSETHGIDFVLSVSLDEEELPENVKKNVLISL